MGLDVKTMVRNLPVNGSGVSTPKATTSATGIHWRLRGSDKRGGGTMTVNSMYKIGSALHQGDFMIDKSA